MVHKNVRRHPRGGAKVRRTGGGDCRRQLFGPDARSCGVAGDGTPAQNAILWLDQRSGEAIDEIYTLLGREWVAQRTQNAIAAGFLLASLYWAKTRAPAFYRAIRWVFLPKDYIKYRLCGAIVTDYSDAAGSLAFDNAQLAWSDELLDRLGIAREIFPQVLPSTVVVGTVSPQAAGLTGLSTRTAVVNGGADQCMQAVGNGMVRPGEFASNIGTAGQISTLASAPVYDPLNRTNTFAHVVPGCWNVMGACLNSGISRRWISKDILMETDYQALGCRRGTGAAGSGGLIFLPYLTGERTAAHGRQGERDVLRPDAQARAYGTGARSDGRRCLCAQGLPEPAAVAGAAL